VDAGIDFTKCLAKFEVFFTQYRYPYCRKIDYEEGCGCSKKCKNVFVLTRHISPPEMVTRLLYLNNPGGGF